MKIFAIGMNYAAHNKAMNETLLREEPPVIFTKADSSLISNHKPFFIPDDMGRIDYEGEVVVRICRLGKTIPERFAHRYYDAVTMGIDFTARDMQRRCKEKGLPGTYVKVLTARQPSANGFPRKSSSTCSASASISTSTGRRCRKAVRPT